MNAPRFLHSAVDIIRLGPRSFLLYDVARDRRYECGAQERWLLDRLNRNEPAADMRDGFHRTFGRQLPARDLESFIHHLRRLHLTDEPSEKLTQPLDPPLPPVPLSRRDPGARLNHAFDWLVVLFGWMLHPLWIAPLLVLSMIALVGYVQHVDLVMSHLAALFRGSLGTTILLLLAVRALITLPGGLLFGMACRKHLDRIQYFGVHWWYHVLPRFVCRAEDPACAEPGRWTKVSIELWFHLALFAFSTLAWFLAPSPSILSDALILATIVGGLGFLIRLSPFEQTPVYAWLCYRLKVNALLSRALAETKAWLLFQRDPEPLSRKERFWFRVYGLCVCVTRSLLAFLLGMLLYVRFEATGLVVLCIILWVWHREVSKPPESPRPAATLQGALTSQGVGARGG